jgi:hypothetical protein
MPSAAISVRDDRERPDVADSVAKVPDEGPISNNRIGTSGFPNQHCALASDLESMLLAYALKIVLQHYRHICDMS